MSESDDVVIRNQMVDGVDESPKISWLLQVVLNNLGVNVNESTVKFCSSIRFFGKNPQFNILCCSTA